MGELRVLHESRGLEVFQKSRPGQVCRMVYSLTAPSHTASQDPDNTRTGRTDLQREAVSSRMYVSLSL